MGVLAIKVVKQLYIMCPRDKKGNFFAGFYHIHKNCITDKDFKLV